MLKYIDTKIVFREVPDETTLAINISGCPFNCRGCHSDYLQYDAGLPLIPIELDWLICANDGITCVSFMGGDGDVKALSKLFGYVKTKYPTLKIAWYSGSNQPEGYNIIKNLDYYKYGAYIMSCGPLTSPNTNQKFCKVHTNYTKKTVKLEDITHVFWSNNQKNEDVEEEENED